MYYSQQPRPQSPARLHDPSATVPWTRLPIPPQSQQQQQNTYGLVQYTNGNTHHNPSLLHHHHPHHHQHQSIGSYLPSLYHSPSHLHATHRQAAEASPPVQPAAPIPKHWQSQLDHADACRKASAPHARARTAANNTRSTAKNAIAITDPNRKTAVETNGVNGHHSNQNSISEIASEAGGTATSEGHSTTSAAISTPPPPRPFLTRKADNSWSALDLGGMRLKNLSPAIFTYEHLTTLYLNHNQLTHVPPAISSLRRLTVLDLSCNQLDTLPIELGLCVSLEHLWLFDNNLETIPPELGSLHQLKLLGIEGNPLRSELLDIIRVQGTPALIAHLRDSCPVPMPPARRAWRNSIPEPDLKGLEEDPDTFTLMTFNILCEKAATPALYGYTPSWALAWSYRKELILTELKNQNSDIMCLQEVDVAQYEDYFSPKLAESGYDGIYSARGRARNMADTERRLVDGCAIFFKASKFRLVKEVTVDFAQVAIQRDDFTKNNDMFNRLLSRDHIAVIALLENKKTGSRLIVSNCHILWDPSMRDVKLLQTGILMDSLNGIAQWFAQLPPRLPTPPTTANGDAHTPKPPVYSDYRDIPVIVSGDFNSMPGSGVYDFLLHGRIPSNHPDFMGFVYGKFTADGLHHDFGLRSAYSDIGELPFTNFTSGFDGVLDYVWYNTQALGVNRVLGEIDPEYIARTVGFPNAHFPSDHLPIVSEFRVKKERTSH